MELYQENIFTVNTDFTIYKREVCSSGHTIAGKIADEILTLPLYAGLSEEEVDRICDIIIK